MSMRIKTKRRLLILGVSAVLLIGAIVIFVVVRRAQIKSNLLAERAAGLSSFKEGDYDNALKHLSKYLSDQRFQSDAEALLPYGKSRAKLQLRNGRHIVEAIGIFKRYLELRPDDMEVRLLLLDLYTRAGYNTEALTLAQRLLETDPNNKEALKAQAIAQYRTGKKSEALQTALKWNKIDPLDLDGQCLTYDIMAAVQRSGDEMLQRAAEARAAHPNDPRFDVLTAYAYRYAIQQNPNEDSRKAMREQAVNYLRAAAKNPAADAAFVRQLAWMFDGFGLFDEAEQVLVKSVGSGSDPTLLRLLVERLYQAGKYQAILDRLKDVNEDSAMSDSRLLGFRALANYQLGRRDEAKKTVAALSERRDDEAALAWSSALKTRFESPDMDPHEAAGEYQSALLRDTNNAVIGLWSGECYARLGENELAIQQWREVAQSAPSWNEPRFQIARTLAIARFAKLDARNTQAVAELKALVDRVRQMRPNEPRTLPIYVAVLAIQIQKEEAEAAVRLGLEAAEKNPESRPDPETLNRLLAVARSFKLAGEPQILEKYKQWWGDGPQYAYLLAGDKHSGGQDAQGLQLLRDAAKGKENQAAWRLALAKYQELTKSPDAAATWSALGKDFPKNLAVQEMILQAPSAAADRDLLAQTIERLKNLTGEEGMSWRLARARWLLGSGNKDRDSAEAVVMLQDVTQTSPNLPEGRKLLAVAFENVGNLSSAIDQWKKAVELEPEDGTAMMELVRLLQSTGRLSEAQPYLNYLAEASKTNPNLRKYVATLLQQQGRPADALKVLGSDSNDAPADLMRAQLLRKSGKLDEAELLYEQLLSRPSADAATAQAAADLAATRGKMDKAQAILSRLEELKSPPAQAALVRAAFYEKFVDKQKALEQYQAAIKADEKNPDAWRQLIGYHIRRGDWNSANSAAAQAAAALPNNEAMAALKQKISAMGANASGGDLQPLIDALSRDPGNDAAVQTLRITNESRKNGESSEQTLAKLRPVADRNPRFVPLQMLMARNYLQMGKFSDAEAVLLRTAAAIPDDAESCKMLAQLYATQQRWAEMLNSAQQWRQRSLEQPYPADLVIAEAEVRLKNPAAALKTLSPYLEMARKNPDANGRLLSTYARTLILARSFQEAEDLLLPLLPKSKIWRAEWMVIAAGGDLPFDTASAWLEKVAKLISANADDEHTSLAKAWYDLAQRSAGADKTAALQAARSILVPLSKSEKPTWESMLVLASTAEQLNDLPTAQSAYRKVIELQPGADVAAGARNNLAMVLLGLNDDAKLPEALDLARQAVGLADRAGNFQDTLARVYLRQGKLTEAIAAFDQALKLEPNYLDAMIGLTDALARDKQRDRALLLLDQIDDLRRTRPPLSEPIAKQLAAARGLLKK